MEQWIHYLQLGMPDIPGISNNLLAPKKAISSSRKPPDKHIDLAEVCLLVPQVSKLILHAHVSQDYNAVLRAMSKSCHFTSVKRILLPLNTKTNKDGMHIAEDREGTHWILAELHLSSNTVHLFDWIGNSSPKDYQQISGVVVLPPIKMPTVPALQHCLSCHGVSTLIVWACPIFIESLLNYYAMCAAPLCGLLNVMHSRCCGLQATNKSPDMILHQQNAQRNAFECGVWTLYTMYHRCQ